MLSLWGKKSYFEMRKLPRLYSLKPSYAISIEWQKPEFKINSNCIVCSTLHFKRNSIIRWLRCSLKYFPSYSNVIDWKNVIMCRIYHRN